MYFISMSRRVGFPSGIWKWGPATAVPADVPDARRAGGGAPTLSLVPETVSSTPAPSGARTLHEIEMEHVLRVLEKHAGNKPAAAKELGISLKTLYNKLNQMQEERKSAG